MFSERDVLNFSAAQRKMLIDHVDGAVPINWNDNSGGVRRVLLSRKLLRGEPHGTSRPQWTVLTEDGRDALGAILGDCADTLVRAGLLEEKSPLRILELMKAVISRASAANRPIPGEAPRGAG